ncbi:MFS transporter [Alkalicoccus daliensis]|uniref:Major Facilitator Superfamily protein n=1 Tax=Alkalicoccus daliensis TaxID=745820 RepID=A0A1H0K014_9BACI|nr:MFS transporter [Alkalicoccus daliensis]SDO49378.1 Major Facilitator Superfamily protein [Alkalicoccus daliensis]
MKAKNLFKKWKYPSILLLGIGISNLGAWMYLIALNLIIFNLTGSPLAVAVLYILLPVAALATNLWAGSVVDRLNKRNCMIFLDIFRAILIFQIPWLLEHSLWLVYMIVFFINMAGAVFGPASMVYITKLIPVKERRKFNSFRSLIDSGAFLLGPALAGLLFMVGSPEFAITFNACAFFFSGMITLFMPDLEKNLKNDLGKEKISSAMLKKDFFMVMNFSRKHLYIMLVYFLFTSVIIMTEAVDSLEAAFAKEVLLLSDSDYGFLVSIAGAGIIAGAILNTLLVKKLTVSALIGLGAVFVSSGYLLYAFSHTFFMAAAGFFFLSFFTAFIHTGFLTFYQNNIPVEEMGRISSIYELIQAVFVIFTTLLIGFLAQAVSIQNAVIAGAFVMLFFAAVLSFFCMPASKKEYFQDIPVEETKAV